MLIAPVAVIPGGREPRAPEGRRRDDRAQYGPSHGRAFVGDGLATMLSGSVGGSGVTTYAENIGVMAVTKVYSTLVVCRRSADCRFVGFLAEVRRINPHHSPGR